MNGNQRGMKCLEKGMNAFAFAHRVEAIKQMSKDKHR